jgi:glucosyl-3-phosphoglycerate synthase
MVVAPPVERDRAGIRCVDHRDYPLERLLAAKSDTTVSVCLPARNEEATVGAIVEVLHRNLLRVGAVDEIVVVDDHSTDRTAQVARAAGARVVDARDVLVDAGLGHGKGEVLWKSLLVTEGDVVVWCDADLRDFDARFVRGVLGPLLCDPGTDFAKGFYSRPEQDGTGGGRVTELVARPLVSLLFPELADLHQPLSGEYGGRRSVLERLPFVEGYGVEIGLCIDYVRRYGTGGLVQVDLDVRHHRNRSLEDLGPQAMAVMQTMLRRVDRDLVPAVAELLRPDGTTVEVDVAERPPMIEVAEYLARHASRIAAPVLSGAPVAAAIADAGDAPALS